MNLQTVIVLLCLLLCAACPAPAVDNPDQPDFRAEVAERFDRLAEHLLKRATTTAQMIAAYQELEQAWDKELNLVYSRLRGTLIPSQKEALKKAQIAWLKYRDLEFALLSELYTQNSHGSSFRVEIASRRGDVIRARVLALLGYLN